MVVAGVGRMEEFKIGKEWLKEVEPAPKMFDIERFLLSGVDVDQP